MRSCEKLKPFIMFVAVLFTLGLGCDNEQGTEVEEDAGLDSFDEGDSDLQEGDADEEVETPVTPLTEDFARYLSGRFDSSSQASSNPQYYPVQLTTCRIQVPDLGETVLYVEQAMMDTPNAPYRQRLYVLDFGDDPETEVVSTVWELESPERAVGFCETPGALSLTLEDVFARRGCSTYMRWLDDHFEGGTSGRECESSLYGATYATSIVEIYENRMESWDRGFDDEGDQVWGAVAGPYVFDSNTPMATE